MKDKKLSGSKSSKVEATPEQKKQFEKEKAKQVDKDQPQFDPDSDDDTTGKSEVFEKPEDQSGPERLFRI
jgi:hypothetical protein